MNQAMIQTATIVAHIWWCGDEVCNCNCPKVVLQVKEKGQNFYKFFSIWEGEFHTDGEHLGYMQCAITEKAKEFGIALDDCFFGSRPATKEEVDRYLNEERKELNG